MIWISAGHQFRYYEPLDMCQELFILFLLHVWYLKLIKKKKQSVLKNISCSKTILWPIIVNVTSQYRLLYLGKFQYIWHVHVKSICKWSQERALVGTNHFVETNNNINKYSYKAFVLYDLNFMWVNSISGYCSTTFTIVDWFEIV